jgi:hypothetical protein
MTHDKPWLSTKILIHPEIAASALEARCEDLYMIWLVIKSIDNKVGAGRGLVGQKQLLSVIQMLLAQTVKSKHSYAKIHQGIDRFWTKPHGAHGKKTIGVYSRKRVYELLGANTPPAKPVGISVEQLLEVYSRSRTANSPDGRGAIRSFLMGIVAARHCDGRPLALSSISETTRFSKRAIQRHLQDCQGLKVVPNYITVARTDDQATATNVITQLVKSGMTNANGLRIVVTQQGEYLVCQRRGNSHWFPELDWRPKSSRPQELRKFDQDILYRLAKRRYCFNPKHARKSTTATSYYIPQGNGTAPRRQKVYIWAPSCPSEVQDARDIQPTRVFRRMGLYREPSNIG